MRTVRWLALMIGLFCVSALRADGVMAAVWTLQGEVADSVTHQPLGYVGVTLTRPDGSRRWMQTDERGAFRFSSVPAGSCQLSFRHVGYHLKTQTMAVTSDVTVHFYLSPQSHLLKDIVVTASESAGVTSSSTIDRKAMAHLQPSSFTDLLALLPGGKTRLPALTQANTLRLREAGGGGADYDFSSLGNLFVTDGIPVSTSGNMQLVRQASAGAYGDPDASRNHTGRGVDMRTLSTDAIEKVEVVRGIASAEYGDLTGGVVLIQRKLKATPWEARTKADAYSKLCYVGKGWADRRRGFTVNVGLDYLDARRDPRISFENYKRLTASVRGAKTWRPTAGGLLRWRSALDYTGSFDDEKTDPEVMTSKEDSYASSYNAWGWSNTLVMEWRRRRGLSAVQLDVAARYEADEIRQDKRVSLARDQIVSTALAEGEHEGSYLPYSYLARVRVDGKPFSSFTKLKALFCYDTERTEQLLNGGAEWRSDKNFGHGQVYDPARPITPGTPYRPRVYKDIPSQHLISAYVQDRFTARVGAHRFVAEGGARALALCHLPRHYVLRGKWFVDPRFNLQWNFPSVWLAGKNLTAFISGGWGKQTKFPTLMQLYPDRVYKDIVQLNYFNLNPDWRRVWLRTYVENPTNPKLGPARNRKWEIRWGAAYNGHRFSATYFQENTSDGFRMSGDARPYTFKDYDENSINSQQLNHRPDLNEFTYKNDTILGMSGRVTNGSSLKKQGVEFQYSSRRIAALRTRFTVNGAWFKTIYSNSQPMFMQTSSKVIGGVPVSDKYIGYYETEDGMECQSFNTNFMADTYIPRLGLSFSVTAECTWWNSSRMLKRNGTPLGYMDVNGKLLPFTEADIHHIYKQWLVQKFHPDFFKEEKVPFYAYINFKVTKNFGKYMNIALFIDRILDYLPDYKTNSGLTIRRVSRPYFGVEMNLTI